MSLDVYLQRVQLTTIYEANITHNMSRMAREVDLYIPLSYQLLSPREFLRVSPVHHVTPEATG